MFRRGAGGALILDVGEKSADEAGVEFRPVAFVDGDFWGAEEVHGALDLTDDGLTEAVADVTGVFGLQELSKIVGIRRCIQSMPEMGYIVP